MDKKGKVFILLLILIIGMNILIYVLLNESEKNEISGEEIYQVLELDNCFRIDIFATEYRYEGRRQGEEKSYSITEEKEMKGILDLIWDSDPDSIFIKDALTEGRIISPLTHSMNLNRKNNTSINIDYSIETNELLFSHSEQLKDLTNESGPLYSKRILIEMDDQFKEIIENLNGSEK